MVIVGNLYCSDNFCLLTICFSAWDLFFYIHLFISYWNFYGLYFQIAVKLLIFICGPHLHSVCLKDQWIEYNKHSLKMPFRHIKIA